MQTSCVSRQYGPYMPFHIYLCLVLPHPQPLQRPLTHADHVKWKRQRCFMSLYPRSPFFSIGRRHLIFLRLKIDPFRPSLPLPTPPQPSPSFAPGVQAFNGKSLCVMPILHFHVPDKAPRLHSQLCVSLWERDVRILYAIRLIESVWFLDTLIRESQSDKDWFPQSCKPDLGTHRNVSQSHRTMSIFENGLLWSAWETASVFGHWVEPFWEACIIHAALEGLRYFTKGRRTASAFYEQLSYHRRLICLSAWCSLNAHRPSRWTDDSVIWISLNQKL